MATASRPATTGGASKAAMTITQPALVSSPQSRPAPTRRALPSKLAAQRGQNWTPIQGQYCKPIDNQADGWRTSSEGVPARDRSRTSAINAKAPRAEDLIRNSCSAGAKIPNYGSAKPPIRLQMRSDFAPKVSHRERNFWMQRQGARNRHESG